MSSRILQTSLTQLPRQLTLGYAPLPWLQGNVQVLRYQTLQPDPANPISRPYFLEPQLNLFGYRPNVFKTDFSMVGQYTRFTHDDVANRDRGERMVFYPQFTLPVINPAYQITPKIGLHMTSYALDRAAVNAGLTGNPSRVVPIMSLDSTLFLERETSLLGKAFIQTLEPRLYYLNIPYRDQSAIPVFDSGLTDFNFAQVFAENRYSGYDRLNDANQLTGAVTTRFLNAETGVERFKAMIGQRYYFKPQRVTLPGETVRTENFSNVISAMTGLVAPKTYADAAWEFNYREHVNERFSLGMRFQPELGKVLSGSYRYIRNPLTGQSTVDQFDIAGQWPLSAKLFAVGRYNYSLRDKQMLEAIAGFEYNEGCWALRLVGQRLEALAGKPNTSVFFQLELNDFASIGANPIGLLRRTIPGYGKTNELPSGSQLLSNQ
jgi:LPS-assembly protein